MKAEIKKSYIHYKNKKEYVVLYIGVHTETGEEMVVYEGQYTDKKFGKNPVWIRPKVMFEGKVDSGGKEIDRFIAI